MHNRWTYRGFRKLLEMRKLSRRLLKKLRKKKSKTPSLKLFIANKLLHHNPFFISQKRKKKSRNYMLYCKEHANKFQVLKGPFKSR